MLLRDTTEESWFQIQPAQSIQEIGKAVNYSDYFHIKSLLSLTPFFLHVFRKPNEEFNSGRVFELNAGYEPSQLKAKVFMSFDEHMK